MCLKVSKFTTLCTNTEFTQPRGGSVFVFMQRFNDQLKVSKFTKLCRNTEFTQPRGGSVFVFMHRSNNQLETSAD